MRQFLHTVQPLIRHKDGIKTVGFVLQRVSVGGRRMRERGRGSTANRRLSTCRGPALFCRHFVPRRGATSLLCHQLNDVFWQLARNCACSCQLSRDRRSITHPRGPQSVCVPSNEGTRRWQAAGSAEEKFSECNWRECFSLFVCLLLILSKREASRESCGRKLSSRGVTVRQVWHVTATETSQSSWSGEEGRWHWIKMKTYLFRSQFQPIQMLMQWKKSSRSSV